MQNTFLGMVFQSWMKLKSIYNLRFTGKSIGWSLESRLVEKQPKYWCTFVVVFERNASCSAVPLKDIFKVLTFSIQEVWKALFTPFHELLNIYILYSHFIYRYIQEYIFFSNRSSNVYGVQVRFGPQHKRPTTKVPCYQMYKDHQHWALA